MALIEVQDVSKTYQVSQRKKGFVNSLLSVFSRDYELKKAVDQVSFQVKEGELIGYIGPNGAGKSTTIKMLTGILVPTSGVVLVNGKEPYKHRKENAKQIGAVFGQRSQLYWSLPMQETFDLYRKIFRIEPQQFKRNVDFYVELLEMEAFLRTPVRQLSLGQRMRAELVVSLLHDPQILYLDEPTIGLDVMVKQRIRKFIRDVNREKNITVILTTHDMDDIEEICDRVITIDEGKIVYDGPLQHFKNEYSSGTVIAVELMTDTVVLADPRLSIIREEGPKKWVLLEQDTITLAEAVTLITRHNEIVDIQIMEPQIEEAVKRIYEKYEG